MLSEDCIDDIRYLYYIENYSIREITERTGLSRKTITKYIDNVTERELLLLIADEPEQ